MDYQAERRNMNYKFTDLDRRTYERNSKGQITIETNAKTDDSVDLVISESKGDFIFLDYAVV